MSRQIAKDKAALDEWTIAHMALGAAQAARGWGPLTTVLFAVCWEIVEWRIDRVPGTVISVTPESAVNAVVDIGANFAGWALYHNRRKVQ